MYCEDPTSCHKVNLNQTACGKQPYTVCILQEPRPDVYPLTYLAKTDPLCTYGCSQYCLDLTCSGPGNCSSMDVEQCQNCRGGGPSCPGKCVLNIYRPCENKTECLRYKNTLYNKY